MKGKTSLLLLAYVVIIAPSFAQQYVTYDLASPMNKWHLASTPRGSPDSSGNILFTEAEFDNELWYSFNRAKLAWYQIDPLFLRNNSATPDNIKNNDPEQLNHYAREIAEDEIYPERHSSLQNNIPTFNLAYYPQERGQYNYEHSLAGSAFSAGLDSSGMLRNPASRWGGVMRGLDNTDFNAAKIKYIVFWLLDPFLYDSASKGGTLNIQIGNISEDVNKDSRKMSEAFLSCNIQQADSTAWGIIPVSHTGSYTSFNSDVAERACQDIGIDGLNDDDERSFYQWYLDSLQSFLTPDAFQLVDLDPSGDDYHYFLGNDYDVMAFGINERYKKYNGVEGNSPVSSSGQTITEASTYVPDDEDINYDHTLSESEEYYQYTLQLKPRMEEGENFIVEKRELTNVETIPGDQPPVWYKFKVPVDDYSAKIGNLPDFRSIRFLRIFLTGFEKPVILRFAQLGLESTDTIVPVLNTTVSIYPNPSPGKITIQYNDADITGIDVYNVLGQLIWPLNVSLLNDAKKIELDLGFQRGVYFIRLKSKDSSTTTKVLIR